MLCNSFLASLPAQQSLPENVPLAAQMITIWPIDNPNVLQGKEECEVMLEHYDLYGGQSAITDAVRQGQQLTGPGPFLIGWAPSNSRYIPDAVVLVIDMSDYETQDRFDEALRFWQEKVVQDPQLWKSGFSIEGIRLAARDFVDHYGSDILKALNIDRK
jgi:hypothetical protein